MKKISVILLAFFLVRCSINTIAQDLPSNQEHFIENYARQKFYEYGCNPPEYSKWTIMKQQSTWDVSFDDAFSGARQTIRFVWDGESEYAETTFVQIDNQIRFTR